MSTENKVYKDLNRLTTQELSEVVRKGGIGDITQETLEKSKQIAVELLEDYKKDRNKSKLVGIASQFSSAEDGVDGAYGYFKSYVSEVQWVENQKQSMGNHVKSEPYLMTHLIYKNVGDKKALARPLTLCGLVEDLEAKEELSGIKGVIIKNIGNKLKDTRWYLDKVDQESVRNDYYQVQPEGRYLKNKNVLSLENYIRAVKTYTHWRGDTSDEDYIIYLAYLTTLVKFRNTKIVTDKTKVFFRVLREKDLRLSKKIQTDELFNKTRIYVDEWYTIVLRGRFILIDNMRNKVIINKTPTEIAKKDIEMMAMLLEGSPLNYRV